MLRTNSVTVNAADTKPVPLVAGAIAGTGLSGARTRPSGSVPDQLLHHYYQQNVRVAVSVLAGNVVLAALVVNHVVLSELLIWGAVVLLLQFVHAVIISRLPHYTRYSAERRLQIIAVSNIVTSLAHVSLMPLFYAELPVINGVLLICVYLSFWAGGLGLCMGFVPNYLSYVLPAALVILGCLALWAAIDPLLRVAICVGLAAYVFYLVDVARDMYGLFAEAVSSREKVNALNGRLNEALAAAESANASKTRFLASASHDLRQPLHALSLFSAALSVKKLAPDSRVIADHLNTAVGALSSQMDALLDISKLDAGLLETKITTVNLSVLLQRLREDFGNEAAEKGLGLQCEIPTEAWAATDLVLLERVLRNLMSNSLRYTDSGTLSLSLETTGDRHRIAVADTGKGIPEIEQQRVFDEFYQLNNAGRDRNKGLGLGLSIVQRICRLLNVALQLESRLGVGTTFTLEIPVAQSAVGQNITVSESDWVSQQLGGRILVIDDEPEIVAAMQSLLNSFGCEVVTASNTQEALIVSAEHPPKLVLADFRLQDDDSGIRAIESLRQQQPELPALLITGDTAPERLQEADRAGLRMLHKPVPAEVLFREVQLILGQSSSGKLAV